MLSCKTHIYRSFRAVLLLVASPCANDLHAVQTWICSVTFDSSFSDDVIFSALPSFPRIVGRVFHCFCFSSRRFQFVAPKDLAEAQHFKETPPRLTRVTDWDRKMFEKMNKCLAFFFLNGDPETSHCTAQRHSAKTRHITRHLTFHGIIHRHRQHHGHRQLPPSQSGLLILTSPWGPISLSQKTENGPLGPFSFFTTAPQMVQNTMYIREEPFEKMDSFLRCATFPK